MRSRIMMILMLTGLLGTVNAQNLNVLVWDHDNGATVAHRQTRRWVGTEVPLKEGLESLNCTVTLSRRLPENLADYDMVMVCLGFLAPS